MKNNLLTFLIFFLFLSLYGCSLKKKNREIANKNESSNHMNLKDTLSTIEGLSNYVLKLKFDQIENDRLLIRKFKIRRGRMEDEGVEWSDYEFIYNSKISITVENNWQDSSRVSRISFLDGQFQTEDKVAVNSPFSDIRNQVDSGRLNESPDGLLTFHISRMKNISFNIDVSKNKELFYGIKNIRQVPDSLLITSIVIK